MQGAVQPPSRGRLLGQGFLERELQHSQPWQALHTQHLAAIQGSLAAIVADVNTGGAPKAADTRHRVVWPVLRCLGWRDGQGHRPTRQGDSFGKQRPHGQGRVVLKTTPWQANLDQGFAGGPAPAASMVADLLRADRPRWGILTNGDRWRLYDGQARSVARGFLEIQLLQALKQPHLLKQFVVFFGPQALGQRQDGSCWLRAILAAHDRHQERSATVFMEQACRQVFPALATAVAQAAPTAPEAVVREASLVILYRLLFLLYGEGRGLLSSATSDPANSLHGLAHRVAEAQHRGQAASPDHHSHWAIITALCRDMAHKHPGLGQLGHHLFSEQQVPLLEQVSRHGTCNDQVMAHVLMGLCFTRKGEPIDYGHLAVEQLGALYEQLMACKLKREGGHLTVETSRLSRKTASCYYTPGELVDLVLQETMAPLVQGRSAQQLLNLKICDPAMGTGHFLIGVLDHLSDAVLAASASPPFSSPPVSSVGQNGQTVGNLVLQHCLYGVDKDPMAVDLARMALLLHGESLDAGHLDHHLHWGNSLFGGWIDDAVKTIRDEAGARTLQDLVKRSRNAAAPIAAMDTATLPTRASAQHWQALEQANAPLEAVLSAVHTRHWLGANSANGLEVVDRLWRGHWGNPVHVVTGVLPVTDQHLVQILARMNAVMAQERLFHWQLACPGLWGEGDGEQPNGGFDAVVGNPPWDRVKLQQVEWFAQHCPEVARAPHAAARQQRIAQLQRHQAPQAVAYGRAAAHRAAQAHVARSCGDYPLLSGGDLNFYALFVERAMALVNPHGLVGMVTPSGLVSGKTGAAFFRRIVQEGRLKTLYDFENSKTFFPDVHGSLRFCVFVARKTSQDGVHHGANCAFRLGSISALKDPARRFLLHGEDFARVNPNTGTAPLFQSRRDARITRGIYGRLPVLVNRSGSVVRRTWPVTYRRMVDMSADSHGFRSAPENESWLPLYEGKMVQAFDHRAADVVVNENNVFRPAHQRLLQDADKASPHRRPQWRHYVKVDAKQWFWPESWVVAFKDVTSTTNMRTMIAAVLPRAAVSHKLPLLLLNGTISRRPTWACFILANLNSIVFDFVVRQKLYGTSLTLHILEQLPVVPLSLFNLPMGSTTIAAIIKAAVLELTYTAWDLTAFARDLGHQGPPFTWDPQRRLHLRARLDALFFLLYGITSESEIRYVYSTFSILQREELALYGRYKSVEACLKALRTFQRLGQPISRPALCLNEPGSKTPDPRMAS